MLKLFSIFIKNINNRLNFLLIIKKLDLSTLSTLLSTREPKEGSFFKHAQPQTKKLCAYKKKCIRRETNRPLRTHFGNQNNPFLHV